VLTAVTVVIAAFLTLSEAKIPDRVISPGHSLDSPFAKGADRVESPLKNTLAMIRWNSAHPERIPQLMKYQPFFHTVHISMPDLLPDLDPGFHNLTHDQFSATYTVYTQLARTMRLILANYPQIDGLMYYHFDAWIDPMAWSNMKQKNIWYPSTSDRAPKEVFEPQFVCMTDTAGYPWWGWEENYHVKSMAAAEAVLRSDAGYKVRRDEWCVGWSDIYYMPRRFFYDYIFLAEIFAKFDVFHEVAIPTMFHIIDQTRRTNPFRPVLDRIGDCWGSCCSSDPTVDDVRFARCGHRLDYLQPPVVDAFYDKLDGQAKMLGQARNETSETW
jgi:hypothetical protein